MGVSPRANMMGQRVFIIALMASFCVALPTTDLVVPEAKDSGTSGAEFVQSTLKSGGTETQCRTFATDTISGINTGVTSEQGVLAAIDTGAGCAQEGQSGVATATTNKANADAVVVTKTQAVTDATATQATACNAPVTMVVNLPTLTASTCYDYTQEAHFLSVQGACDAANTALSQANSGLSAAQTAATDAQTDLDAAVAEAARLMSECHCRVQQEQAAAWTAAGTATASHAADWKQAHEVLCALDQTSTCTVPTCPAVTQPTLAAGVADEVCSTEPTATIVTNGPSWTASQQVCTNQDKQLCTFDQICPNGEGSTPVDGGSSIAHDWSAMLRADGVTNDWVLISGSGHSNCKPHDKYHGLPTWGLTNGNAYNNRVYCCSDDTALVDPVNQCDAHDAAVSFVDGCGMSSTTWTSTGSQDGITMNIDGLSMGSAGVFFNAPRGRSVNYNIGPDAHAQLSIEIWFKETASTSSLGWIIGHDNGGYDRAINIHDHRFGGVAAPPGRTYSSTLGYPSLNQWYHVVATYNQGQSSGNTVFMRQLGGALQSQALPVTRNNGGGLTSFDVGGLTSYGNHHVHADIAVVRVFEKILTEAEVNELYDSRPASLN